MLNSCFLNNLYPILFPPYLFLFYQFCHLKSSCDFRSKSWFCSFLSVSCSSPPCIPTWSATVNRPASPTQYLPSFPWRSIFYVWRLISGNFCFWETSSWIILSRSAASVSFWKAVYFTIPALPIIHSVMKACCSSRFFCFWRSRSDSNLWKMLRNAFFR